MEKQYIYVISNSAFEGWYKVGKTVNVNRRLSDYQTYDPFRGYVLEFCMEVKNPDFHEYHFARITNNENGEWIKEKLSKIINTIKRLEFQRAEYLDKKIKNVFKPAKSKATADKRIEELKRLLNLE